MSRRRRRNSINPDAPAHRQALRTLGFLLVAAGGILTAIGLVDFFSSFGTFGPPTHFWCAFVGLPMLGIGVALLKFGYMGAVARYVAGEAAPVATDTLNYVARGTRQAVRTTTSAIAEGLRDSGDDRASSGGTACPSCGADHAAGARFCDQCGEELAVAKSCPSCDAENDTDARFCDRCGTALR